MNEKKNNLITKKNNLSVWSTLRSVAQQVDIQFDVDLLVFDTYNRK